VVRVESIEQDPSTRDRERSRGGVSSWDEASGWEVL
jgi:hypothetical protein